MTLLRPLLLAAALLVAAPGLMRAQTPPAPALTSIPAAKSLVRVNSTNQPYNFLKPWSKEPPSTRRGVGVVIDGGRVLVTAELIANHSYVELERPESSEKISATVERVDYESNLALLAPQDPAFLIGMPPVELAKDVQVGTRINVVQLESTGSIALTPGVITTITVSGYPADGISLLTYRLSVPLQYRDNSFTMPVFFGNQLAGLLMRYDTRTQSADVVPDAVIASFLARAAHPPYQGIPRAGISFSPTRDPQFRHYLGLKSGQNGVYVVSVANGSPAEKAGLQKGDVILRVGDGNLDDDGNYLHPAYGKIPFSYLVSTANLPGSKLPIRVIRGGKPLELSLPLEARDPSTVISEPAILDRAPRFYILGGLVFQELSRSYLREWGGDWKSNAPPRLTYLDEFQDELPADRGKIVFISDVLPADTTVGYDDVSTPVVRSVNGRPIHNLEDVAAAAQQPVGGFHRIELESSPGMLYLNAKDAIDSASQVRESYGIPALDNLSDPATKAAP